MSKRKRFSSEPTDLIQSKRCKEEYDIMMRALRSVLPVGTPTSCSGTLQLKKPVGIYYGTKDNGLKYSRTPMKLKETRELMNACDVATFGLGKKEVKDETYRKALKLDTDSFATTLLLSETDVLHTVQRILLPQAGYVRAELYKLNIYTKGGFFKPHKDTPRGSGMFGSLVVCLDQPFTGGSFVVEHNGRAQVLDETTSEQGNINWFAFFSDCTHEVKPVKSGCRITLTYNLYRGEDLKNNDLPTQPTISKELYREVRKLIEEGSFKERSVGFPLEHTYVKDEVPTFKGADLLVNNTLEVIMKEYPKVVVAPYLYAEPEANDRYRDDDSDDEGGNGMFIEWGKFRSARHDLYERSPDAGWFRDAYRIEHYPVAWVKNPKNKQYSDTVAAYGNEPSIESVYCGGCILMHM